MTKKAFDPQKEYLDKEMLNMLVTSVFKKSSYFDTDIDPIGSYFTLEDFIRAFIDLVRIPENEKNERIEVFICTDMVNPLEQIKIYFAVFYGEKHYKVCVKASLPDFKEKIKESELKFLVVSLARDIRLCKKAAEIYLGREFYCRHIHDFLNYNLMLSVQ